MAISQNAICERPRVAANPTQTVPKTKTTWVSTRSKRPSSFLSEALRLSTSRSIAARFEGAEFILVRTPPACSTALHWSVAKARRRRAYLGRRTVVVNDAPAVPGFAKQQRESAMGFVAGPFQTPAAQHQGGILAEHVDFEI